MHVGRIEPMTTPNIEHLWRNWSSWKPMIGQSFRNTEKLHSVKFYQTPAQQQFANGERSNVIVQTKTHVGSITPTRTTPKSAKSPSKQPLHKSPIRPPKCIKDRLKNLSPIRPEQLKQKSQLLISQIAKIQMNTKVNKERLGSTFKITSKTKSPKRTLPSRLGLQNTPSAPLQKGKTPLSQVHSGPEW